MLTSNGLGRSSGSSVLVFLFSLLTEKEFSFLKNRNLLDLSMCLKKKAHITTTRIVKLEFF